MPGNNKPRFLRDHGAATAALFIAAASLAAAGSPVVHAQLRTPPAPRRAADTGATEEARRLLQRMFKADMTVPVAGREATFSVVAGGRQSEQVIKRDPKRGLRLEFVRPAGDILVDNFRRSWFLSQAGRRLVERESRLAELRRGIRDVTRQIKDGAMSARVVGEDVVAGRACAIVLVSPPNEGTPVPVRRFWVDRETGLRLKTEEVGPSGRVLSATYFLQVDVRPRFDDADFAPPPLPPGFVKDRQDRRTFASVEAAQKTVGFALRRPNYLPPGFALRHVAVTRRKGGRVVVQRYANGMSGVTLFQTDAPDLPSTAPLPPRGRRDGFGRGPRVQTWRHGDVTFILIGNLPDEQMKRIADSLR